MNFEKEQPPHSSLIRRPGQFGILTLMLLSTAIGSLIAGYQLPKQCRQAQVELAALRRLTDAHQLEVWKRFSALRTDKYLGPGHAWDLYFPPETTYRIAWSTARSMNDSERVDSITPTATAPIAPGEHQVVIHYHLENDQWIVQTIVDDQITLEERLPLVWNPQFGSYSWTDRYGGIELAGGRPYLLHDEVFYTLDMTHPDTLTTKNSKAGLRVWIEPVQP